MSYQEEDLGVVQGTTSEKSGQERWRGRGSVTAMARARARARAKRPGALTKITLVAQRTKQTTMAGPLSAAEQQLAH